MSCYLTKNTQITIKNGFSTGNSGDPLTLKFTIPGLRNPRTTATSGLFSFLVYDTAIKYITYNMTGELNVTMSTGNSIKSVQITRMSSVNGEVNTYSFLVVLNSYV